MRHVIVGTAGHVDHGKTTLIQALTGTNTDRLAEEQARGMTIDLGFAALPLTPELFAGIVDVPGHERFVKNMLAGAGGIEVALLVVAADEGPMPQTREHLEILTVLGVAQGVVALTRTDLADPELQELAIEEIRALLARTPLAGSPIVPVCAPTGAGLDALKAALATAALAAPLRPLDAPFRLPVDRVFSLPGVGTIVTGTLIQGSLTVGAPVSVQPQGLVTKARTLQSHNQKCERADAGMRVAVNLPGVEVGQLERGAILCPPDTLAATTLLDVRLSVLPSAPRPLRHRERIRLHLGTGETLARVILLEGAELVPGATDQPAQLLCETPTAADRAERFVARTYSPARTIGGGTVVDPQPARKYRRGDAAALALFEARGTDAPAEQLYAQLSARPAAFTATELARTLQLPLESVSALAEALIDDGRAVALDGETYLSDRAAQRLRETAQRTLTQFHRQNPLRKAMPREHLRAPLSKAATVPHFNAAIGYLLSEGVCLAEGALGLRLPEHTVKLPPHWQAAADHLLSVYKSAGFQPPNPADFQANYPRDVHIPTILTILAEDETLVRISDDLYLAAETYAQARQILRKLGQQPGGISVASFRDATQSSRKVILPLLEHFDGIRFTRRVGDLRVLGEPHS